MTFSPPVVQGRQCFDTNCRTVGPTGTPTATASNETDVGKKWRKRGFSTTK